jgi:hypothetical protein
VTRRDALWGVLLVAAVVVVTAFVVVGLSLLFPCGEGSWCEPGSGGRTVCTCR